MRARRRGYTVVEIMIAMTLFAIGAAGVIGMQRATVQGGTDARNFDTATSIARAWQSRLQRDALSWTQPNSLVSTSNLDSTRWLKTSNIQTPPAWRVPAPGPEVAGYSAAFDMLGRDVAPTSAERMFCVHYRLGWIANSNGGASPTALIRAEVRVVWARLEFEPPACDDLTLAEPANRDRYHFVYVTTALRGNPTL